MGFLPARRAMLLLSLMGLLVGLGASCNHQATTTLAPPQASFEMREVIVSQVGRDALVTHPFTTGVIRANDPYRQNPAFAEAPPDVAGDW